MRVDEKRKIWRKESGGEIKKLERGNLDIKGRKRGRSLEIKKDSEAKLEYLRVKTTRDKYIVPNE